MKILQQSTILVYLVEQMFQNQPSKFDEFAKTLRDLITSIFVKQHQDSTHLISKLKNIFANDQDLLIRFNFFLENQPPLILDQDHNVKKHNSIRHQNIKKRCREDDNLEKNCPKKLHKGKISDLVCDFVNKIYDRCVEKDDFSIFTNYCRVMVSYKEEKFDANKLNSEFSELFKDDPDLFVESTRFVADFLESKESLDYSGFEFLKDDEEGDNVNVANHKKWGLYQQSQLVCEFYMCEMDTAIGRIRSTRKRMKANPEKLKECFTILDHKCIEQLYNGPEKEYGSAGKEMVTMLLENKADVYKVVLKRLKQKKKQLKEQRELSKKIWKEILEDIRQNRIVRHHELLEKTKKESRLFEEF